MKTINSFINEASGRMKAWDVHKNLSYPQKISSFNAPDSDYIWINNEERCMAFIDLDEIISNFEDMDMNNFINDVKNLRPGQAWSIDNENIYVRLT